MCLEKISKLWEHDIASDYASGKITTERALQAALYSHIRWHCPELQIYVEPGMFYYENGGPSAKPDLVLCSKAKIILVAEIKFMPHWYPRYKDDLAKLKRFASEGTDIGHKLQIDPKTGSFTGKSHRITSKTKYAFFVVGRNDSEGAQRDSMQSLLEPNQFEKNFALFYGRIFKGKKIEFGSDWVR